MEELLSKKSNTLLSEINILEYLKILDTFSIEYLEELGINKNYTFGFEIEYENVYKYIIDRFLEKNHLKNWLSIFELDIDVGGEIISPILKDDKKYWMELKQICDFLKRKRIIMNVKSGGHIHIGSQILGNNIDRWKKFLYLYIINENIIYRFFNGEYINGRSSQITSAKPIGNDLANQYESIKKASFEELIQILKKFSKFNGINFNNIKWKTINDVEYKNTIEFRMPNATRNEVIWQNNLYFLIKLIEASKLDLDLDLLEYNIKNNLFPYSEYYKLDLSKAIILADTIFDNNYDKAKFLKQYYKDGNEVKTKKLIKSSKTIIKD